MKANELRIGNWFIEKGDVKQFDGDFYHLLGCVQIPLSQKWLEKFGFERSGLYFVKSQVYIYDEYGLTDTGFEYRFNYTQIKLMYVHQLQNLYFALTGDELTIKC